MKNSKRILSLILASMILLSCVSCSDNVSDDGSKETNPSGSNESTSETEPESPKYLDDLPDTLRFQDEDVRFISSYTYNSITLLEEDDESDIVNEAVWKRNMAISDRLGVKVTLPREEVTGYDQFNSIVKNSVTSSADDFDVLCGHTRFNINLAAEGVLKNLNNMNYIDLTKDYWSQGYNDNIGYKGIHYWATGDLSLEYIKYIYCMFVNSELWNDHYSDVNLYDIVKEGKWTLDALAQYADGAYVDENGNGDVDNNDSFGIVMQKGHVLNGMAFASNVVYTSYDDDGTPYISVNNEHTVDVFTRLHDLFYSTSYGRMLENGDFDGLVEKMFPERHLLFCPNTFIFAENEKIRDMEDNFYIIPMPKYDETQNAYRSGQYDGVPIYGVTITAAEDKLDAIGATLEAMCSLSSQMVVPVYFDKALKNKYSRDMETAEMINIIRDSVVSDFAFAWGDSVGNLYNLFYDNIQGSEIASKMKPMAKVWTKTMKKLLDQLDAKSGN